MDTWFTTSPRASLLNSRVREILNISLWKKNIMWLSLISNTHWAMVGGYMWYIIQTNSDEEKLHGKERIPFSILHNSILSHREENDQLAKDNNTQLKNNSSVLDAGSSLQRPTFQMCTLTKGHPCFRDKGQLHKEWIGPPDRALVLEKETRNVGGVQRNRRTREAWKESSMWLRRNPLMQDHCHAVNRDLWLALRNTESIPKPHPSALSQLWS